jgi:hypothetical protein
MKGNFMLNDMKTMVLPDSNETIRRLTAAYDDPHAVEKLYPIIAKDAGRELNGIGIVMLLMQAIHDYTENMPPMLRNIMLGSMDMFVDALVDNPEVKADAHELINKAKDHLQTASSESTIRRLGRLALQGNAEVDVQITKDHVPILQHDDPRKDS